MFKVLSCKLLVFAVRGSRFAVRGSRFAVRGSPFSVLRSPFSVRGWRGGVVAWWRGGWLVIGLFALSESDLLRTGSPRSSGAFLCEGLHALRELMRSAILACAA
jgi:hypothetical protein